jgi:hypothetical protein
VVAYELDECGNAEIRGTRAFRHGDEAIWPDVAVAQGHQDQRLAFELLFDADRGLKGDEPVASGERRHEPQGTYLDARPRGSGVPDDLQVDPLGSCKVRGRRLPHTDQGSHNSYAVGYGDPAALAP